MKSHSEQSMRRTQINKNKKERKRRRGAPTWIHRRGLVELELVDEQHRFLLHRCNETRAKKAISRGVSETRKGLSSRRKWKGTEGGRGLELLPMTLRTLEIVPAPGAAASRCSDGGGAGGCQ